MANLEKLAANYRSEGYSALLAEARVCQDIVLKAISESSLSRNVTIKGGVVMRSITGNVRRATRDIDFDFIKYSIDEASIQDFIEKLNCLEGLTIKAEGPIEELSQQEYRGKRAWITISDDNGNTLKSKIDIGVHKNVQIEQEEYCFDVCLDDEGASLLMNSSEQIFAEKLRALVRFGTFSGRVKDIFDLKDPILYYPHNKNKNNNNATGSFFRLFTEFCQSVPLFKQFRKKPRVIGICPVS